MIFSLGNGVLQDYTEISSVSWQIVCEVGEIPQLEIENCLLEINKREAVVVEPP